ncbi:PQQ-binding-like beta-propeller repeat protein [Cumulibacter soli]|uniref:outer membrane protein assembly factor BamB family protein n=1 Tax=Cumulibacter soli TaxID=2546344 RepID=UPI0010674C09|nr:PQQ-binding-like beta-propeller repeat protein [Cumulibacter soli]
MSHSTPPHVRSTPRPWSFRLGGWVLVLVVGCALALVALRSGTYSATQHTTASDPPATPTGEPAQVLSEQGTWDPDHYLAGPVIAQVTEHGVIATDLATGDELWRYQRSDTTVCAHRVNPQHVTLIFASGERCDEAVSFDPASGVRQWQRTIEATGPNQIVWDDGIFLSIDPAKTIVFEDGQGFERFTVDNSETDHIEGEHTSCENLDAAGSSTVGTLQRCRANDTEPWLYQVVLDQASDGEPSEVGRGYLSDISNPTIDGVTSDGTTFLRSDDGTLWVLPERQSEAVPLDGMPSVDPNTPLEVVASRATVLLTTPETTYTLSADTTSIAHSQATIATPYVVDTTAYIPTTEGIELLDTASGAVQQTLSWEATTTGPADLVITGEYIGLRDADGLRVYA